MIIAGSVQSTTRATLNRSSNFFTVCRWREMSWDESGPQSYSSDIGEKKKEVSRLVRKGKGMLVRDRGKPVLRDRTPLSILSDRLAIRQQDLVAVARSRPEHVLAYAYITSAASLASNTLACMYILKDHHHHPETGRPPSVHPIAITMSTEVRRTDCRPKNSNCWRSKCFMTT